MARETFTLHKSYYNAIVKLPGELKGIFIDMICDYAFNDHQPDFTEYPILSAFWELVVPMVDANNARRENGKKGGRPSKKRNKD